MAINLRPTYIFEPRPTIIWKEVEGANVYKLKLVSKSCPDVPLWEKVLSRSDLHFSEHHYLEFTYPDYLPALNECVGYLVIAETETPAGVKHAQGEMFMIEAHVRSLLYDFEQELESATSPTLDKCFTLYHSALLMSPPMMANATDLNFAGWRRYCLRLEFS